jgi:uncharacterized damage-inducible protein DinB
MTPMLEPLLNEFRDEVAITKRVLDRVPADKLSWRPHEKSMSLGQLAIHVANIPGNVARLVQLEEFDVSTANFVPTPPNNLEEVHAAFRQSIQAAEDYLQSVSEQAVLGPWRLTAAGKQIFTKPRVAIVRTIMLNHWYHHRGQLSVYLRLLDVPVPVIYGRSADENPFA